MLSGAAGIGKTRIADEIAALASPPFRLVSVTCGPARGTPPFWPWTQVAGDLYDARGKANRPDVASLAAVAALVGGPAQETTPTTPGERGPARARLFEEMVSLLAASANDRPLLVLFDDLHYADASSLLLLAHVSRRIASLPVGILGTWRTGDMKITGEPGADVLRRATVVAVPPLGASQIASLAEAVTGAPAPSSVTEALHRRSSGNPLLAHELLALVTAADGPPQWDVVDFLVPDSARRMATNRLGALPLRARELLAAASVLGTSFPLDVLAECAGADLDMASLLDALAPARDIGVLDSLGPHTGAFSHDLVRDAVYESLPSAARAKMHRSTADALARLADRGRAVEPIELARHYLAAGPGAAGPAVTHARAAAIRAMDLLAYEDAALLYQQALDSLADLDGRADLLLGLGEARSASGDRGGARESYVAAAETARRAGRPDLFAAAALGLSGPGGFEVPMLDRQQIDLLEEALQVLPTDDLVGRASVVARLSVAASFVEPGNRRLAMSAEGVELARRSGDDAALALSLAARCDAIAGPDHCAARAVDAAEIVGLARRLRDRPLELLGRRLRVVALMEQADLVAAAEEAQHFSSTAASLHQPLYEWYAPLWRAMSALAEGRITDCYTSLSEAERLGEQAGSGNAFMLTSTLRWCLNAELDLKNGVDSMLARLEPDQFAAVWPLVTKALGAAQAGRLGEARSRFDAAAPRLAGVEQDSEWIPMLSQAAELVGHLGGHPIAPWLYRALLPYRSQLAIEGIAAVIRGPVERDLGVLAASLGDTGAARAHFDAALDITRDLGTGLLAARARRDAGVALHDGDHLRSARRAYQSLGIDGRVDEIDAMLRGRPPQPRRAGAHPASATADRPRFRRDGDVWHLSYNGQDVTLRDSKGLNDLSRLLERPERPVAALDLAFTDAAGGPIVRAGGPDEADLHAPGDLGETLDAEARDSYKRRLVELEEEIDDADAGADIGRSARATAERDAIVAELSAAYGLGGRARRTGHPAERARSAVTARIRESIKRVEAVHPDLGRHLRRSVRTGRLCVYEPEEQAARPHVVRADLTPPL